MFPCLFPLASPSLPPSLSHPSRWSQSTELISLCYAAASHQLAISHLVVYISPCHSLTLSQLICLLSPSTVFLILNCIVSCVGSFWSFVFLFRFVFLLSSILLYRYATICLSQHLVFFFLAAQQDIWGSQFPDQGLNPRPLHWEFGVLTIARPEKSVSNHLLMNIWVASIWGI